MRATLTRFAYLRECTLGWLSFNDMRWATIERPWIHTPEHRGGRNRESCVPDGEYNLVRHSGPRRENVWALINHNLDVFHFPQGRPGRSAILIHAGNRVRDVIGCIAIGKQHGFIDGEHAVTNSQIALQELRSVFARRLPLLLIRPSRGTQEFSW